MATSLTQVPLAPRAIIADDEEHLRIYLQNKLALFWPELEIVSLAANGLEASDAIIQMKPDVAFLDIKMPGLSGLEVAQAREGQCRFVFVTAYDEFALQAFEREALDFLVKPVEDQRLQKTIKRLKAAIESASPMPDISALFSTLNQPSAPKHLRWIRANQGANTTHIPVAEILYIQSDDKYTIVYTANAEHIVRMPLGELLAGLDPQQFWQIHRSIIVNMDHVTGTRRDDAGKLSVLLRNRKSALPVSRAFAHLFRQM